MRDVSTDDVRIELELKQDADEKMVLAYLFKHTPLQTNFNVNLTCLIPTEQAEVGRPERLDLKAMLWHFLHFRLDVVTKRLEHELGALSRRQHLLEGFAKIFDALDEILRIVRKSEGKADAARQIIARFGLDAEQTDAILELKIYRLARLEIQVIQEELAAARKRSRELRVATRRRAGALADRARGDRGGARPPIPRSARTRAAPPSPPPRPRSSTRPRTSSSTRTTSLSCRATAGSSGRRT